jgi:PAS domain S-box-containing protein
VCIIEGLLIFGLLVQRSNLMRAERRFRQVVEAAPNGMVMVDAKGRILLANSQMEKLFRYPVHQMLGQSVDRLIPERLRSGHRAYRARFFAEPKEHLMVTGPHLCGRRKDGSEFPLEVGLSLLRTDSGPLVLASIVDVSQRRRAGLRESQLELRELAGKLLQAQETERRRIARELHDDLSQSLALLAIELDVLGRKPPESAARHAARMQELSVRVKQLSSSVHELSHQLHPSKLEQLGLVATARALCEEMSQNGAPHVEFHHGEIPERIHEGTALCLYRILQEALNNIIKHSNAHSAAVELTGNAEASILRIADDGSGFDPSSRGRQGKSWIRQHAGTPPRGQRRDHDPFLPLGRHADRRSRSSALRQRKQCQRFFFADDFGRHRIRGPDKTGLLGAFDLLRFLGIEEGGADQDPAHVSASMTMPATTTEGWRRAHLRTRWTGVGRRARIGRLSRKRRRSSANSCAVA